MILLNTLYIHLQHYVSLLRNLTCSWLPMMSHSKSVGTVNLFEQWPAWSLHLFHKEKSHWKPGHLICTTENLNDKKFTSDKQKPMWSNTFEKWVSLSLRKHVLDSWNKENSSLLTKVPCFHISFQAFLSFQNKNLQHDSALKTK